MSGSRVAVIAIHGVGDHQPFEMARAMGDMLENLEDEPRHPRYCAFGEDWVRLNVSPVKVQGHFFPSAASGRHAPEAGKRTWGPLDKLFASRRKVRQIADNQTDSLDHLFMEGQLAGYKGEGPEETYEVLRLKGHRLANAPAGREGGQAEQGAPPVPEKEVHIYDMFWSDLSGVGAAGLRIFGELYQLLFHLGSIGVNNVKAAAITLRDTPSGPAWGRFAFLQTRAAGILALPIPILNLIMLAFTVALVAVACLAKLPVTKEAIITALLLLAGGTALWGRSLMRKGGFGAASFRRPALLFLVLSTAVVVLTMASRRALLSNAAWSEGIECVAGAIAVLAALAAARGVVGAYEKLRPGATRSFPLCLLAVAVLAAVSTPWFLPRSHDFLAMGILLRLIELTFWTILFFWVLFWCVFVAAFAAGALAARKTAADFAEADRAARTNWTARLTLALPATLFLLLAFASWAGILTVALPLLPHDTQPANRDCAMGSLRNPQPASLPGVLCYAPLVPPGAYSRTAADWARDRIYEAGIGYAPVLLLLFSLAAVISIWGLTPSVLDEISPPRGMGAECATEAESLGEWLDQGYRFMRWGGRLIYLGIFLLPLAAALTFMPESYKQVANQFQEALGAMVAGAGIGVLGLGGRLSKLALGFRPIVRVALDVDNWLREHPVNNPTARICGRYVSLLRYIAQWRDSDGRGYDSLIVFAHSQGTIVTSDLLRFLATEAHLTEGGTFQSYDATLAGLDRMKRYLFTMGCPLRQLYGLRFPYLYGYREQLEAKDLLPRPADLGACEWVNAYRTGDYIGRYLWRPQPWQPVGEISFCNWDPPQGIPQSIWHDSGRVEFTIGPGAHTHYWDSTAEPIAETLDVLIAKA